MERMLQLFFLLSIWRGNDVAGKCYESAVLKDIPASHLYHRLRKPVVIGYRGNMVEYQENTVAGFQSLISMKADGIHVQVQPSSDGKVIAYGPTSLYDLTEEPYEVRQLPYSEIQKMSILDTLRYGTVTRKYKGSAKIPLLEEVLQAVQGAPVLVYIELMPDRVPPLGPGERYRGYELAHVISATVRKMNLLDRVFVVSRDAFKLSYLNQIDPAIPLGWWMDGELFNANTAVEMKEHYVDIPDLYVEDCFNNKTTPNGFEFSKFLLTTGLVSKAVNATFVDFAPEIYSDRRYFETLTYKSIRDVVQARYGLTTTFGIYNLFAANETNPDTTASKAADAKLMSSYVKEGVTRIITADVRRVKLAIGEEIGKSSGESASWHGYGSFVILGLVVAKAVASLIFG